MIMIITMKIVTTTTTTTTIMIITNMNRVLKWWRHKNDISEIMGFIQLIRTTYLKKVHTQKNGSLVH